MKSFASRVTLDSALIEFQGVRFTLNRMTEGRRVKLRLSLADATAALREAMQEREALERSGEKDGARATALLERVTEIIEDRVNPAWLRWGLCAIEGLEIDGEPATPESLIDAGPPALYAEILAAIRREAGLTEDEQGNSASPTTSGALVDGAMNGTSAPPASGPATT